MRKLLVAGLVGGAALVLSPFGGCGKSWSFGEKEMAAAVEGTWKVTVDADDPQSAHVLTLKLTQYEVKVDASTGLIPSAHACGKRSMVKTAGACLDETEMRLDVKIVDGWKPELDGDAKNANGTFRVFGNDFHGGSLELKLDRHQVEARLTPTGEVTTSDGYVGTPGSSTRLAVKLERVAK